MSNLTQVLLIVVVTTLTITLTIIGIQLFMILRDIRERIVKVDPILDNVVTEQEYLNEILISAKDTSARVADTSKYLTEEVIEPIGNIVSAVKGISDLVGQFKGRPRDRKHLRQNYDERREADE